MVSLFSNIQGLSDKLQTRKENYTKNAPEKHNKMLT